jgi:hypothetical protein
MSGVEQLQPPRNQAAKEPFYISFGNDYHREGKHTLFRKGGQVDGKD